jgi:hypothetical protein
MLLSIILELFLEIVSVADSRAGRGGRRTNNGRITKLVL